MRQSLSGRELSRSEHRFVAAIQQLRFGRFEYIRIKDGDLVLDPWPTSVRTVKFAEPERIEEATPTPGDGQLKRQFAAFLLYVRSVTDGEIRRLEVRHGLPFAMEIEEAASEGMALHG